MQVRTRPIRDDLDVVLADLLHVTGLNDNFQNHSK